MIERPVTREHTPAEAQSYVSLYEQRRAMAQCAFCGEKITADEGFNYVVDMNGDSIDWHQRDCKYQFAGSVNKRDWEDSYIKRAVKIGIGVETCSPERAGEQ